LKAEATGRWQTNSWMALKSIDSFVENVAVNT